MAKFSGTEGNDIFVGTSGSDEIKGGAGNDTIIYSASQNVGTTEKYDGGSGTGDTLQLMLTRDEWLRADIQQDISRAQNFFVAPKGKDFQFTSFDLSAKNVEGLDVYVDGVQVNPADQAVVLAADTVTATEDSAGPAVNLLANDSVPDLVKTLTVTQGEYGTVSVVTDYSDPNNPIANATYTPDAAHWQSLAQGEVGHDAFTYTVTDADGDQATQTVEVAITGGATNYYGLPSRPIHIATADLNGDGMLDLASAAGPYVSVLLGNGDGTFESAIYDAGAYGIAVADLDGDGHLDIATSNGSEPGAANVLLGSGDDTFLFHGSYATGLFPAQVVSGDLNDDGVVDVAMNSGSSVEVLIGNGDGSFGPVLQNEVGYAPAGLDIGDLNGDGNLDLVAGHLFVDEVSVLLGRGDGTFEAAVNHAVGSRPAGVEMADLNGDGNLDVSTVNQNGSTVSVLLGIGDGTFGPQTSYALGGGFAGPGIESGDMNGDGNIDLVATLWDNSGVSILTGNGDGTFQAAQTFHAGSNVFDVAVGDWNGDENLDMALTDHTGSNVIVLINQQDFLLV